MRMTTVALVALSCALTAPTTAKAQQQEEPLKFARAWTLPDSITAARQHVRSFFQGIPLTPADSAKAVSAFLRCFVDAYRPNGYRSQADMDSVARLVDKRDSILVSLIADPALRDTLKARLAERRAPSLRKK